MTQRDMVPPHRQEDYARTLDAAGLPVLHSIPLDPEPEYCPDTGEAIAPIGFCRPCLWRERRPCRNR